MQGEWALKPAALLAGRRRILVTGGAGYGLRPTA
jgi:hypothetical protein